MGPPLLAPAISAVCYSLSEPWKADRVTREAGVAFVFRQFQRLPGYLRVAIWGLTGCINLGVCLTTGRPLEAHGPESRRRVLAILERWGPGPVRDWFRFYRILMALRCHQ